MNIGDKYLCNETINSFIGFPLFEKGEIYEVLDCDNETVTLNHNLIANEYMAYEYEILKKFTSMKILKKENLLLLESLVKRFPNDGDLGIQVRTLFLDDEFVKKMPNDRELGTEIRKLFYKFKN